MGKRRQVTGWTAGLCWAIALGALGALACGSDGDSDFSEATGGSPSASGGSGGTPTATGGSPTVTGGTGGSPTATGGTGGSSSTTGGSATGTGGAATGGKAGGGAATGGAGKGGSAQTGGTGNAGEDAGGTDQGGEPGEGGMPGEGGSATGGEGGEGGGDVCGCVPETISWGWSGGLVIYTEQSRITSCRNFSHQRDPVTTDPPTLTCMTELVACGDSLGSSDVLLALQNPDVVKALGSAPILYGGDSRPVDGQVYAIQVGGDLIEVGNECGQQTDCNEIPAGVQALVDLLKALTEQELGKPACADVFS